MDRERLIAALVEFDGPLGPFERVEQRERRRAVWLAGLDLGALEGLLSILTDPPDPCAYRPATWEAFEFDVTEALTALGQRDPQHLLEQIGPLLAHERARPAIIDVIGALSSLEGIRWLKPLVEDQQLTADERVRLACSLGEMGGPEARLLLKRMSMLSSAADAEVLREIEIALDNAWRNMRMKS